MKFIPILFSTPMVTAILENRKTQTRRIIKDDKINSKNVISKGKYCNVSICYKGNIYENIFAFARMWKENYVETYHAKAKAQIGDVFWVRETFTEAGNYASEQFANSEVIAYKTKEAFFYDNGAKLDSTYWNWDKIKWKPSIFMPKNACRIFLQVTDVTIERVQDITEADIIDEGVTISNTLELGGKNTPIQFLPNGFLKQKDKDSKIYAMAHWASLWAKINGLASWQANPYVFVYKFKKIPKPLTFNN